VNNTRHPSVTILALTGVADEPRMEQLDRKVRPWCAKIAAPFTTDRAILVVGKLLQLAASAGGRRRLLREPSARAIKMVRSNGLLADLVHAKRRRSRAPLQQR
jgi:hypothetical protein